MYRNRSLVVQRGVDVSRSLEHAPGPSLDPAKRRNGTAVERNAPVVGNTNLVAAGQVDSRAQDQCLRGGLTADLQPQELKIGIGPLACASVVPVFSMMAIQETRGAPASVM